MPRVSRLVCLALSVSFLHLRELSGIEQKKSSPLLVSADT